MKSQLVGNLSSLESSIVLLEEKKQVESQLIRESYQQCGGLCSGLGSGHAPPGVSSIFQALAGEL